MASAMSGNRTTELLMREFVDVACECEVRDYLISEYAERIEQAVAATLGSDDRHDEIYDAGFDSGIKATLQMLEGLIAEGAGMTEIEDWIDEQWKEYES